MPRRNASQEPFTFEIYRGDEKIIKKILDVLLDVGKKATKSDDDLVNLKYSFSLIEENKRFLYNSTKSSLHIWNYSKISRYLASQFNNRFPDRKIGMLVANIPNWVLTYLVNCSFDISCLAQGRDPRKRPIDSNSDEAWHEWAENSLITPENAIDVVPQVLGLSRKGYNAFAEAESERFDEVLSYMAELGGEDDPPTKTARLAKMAEQFGYSDDRALRRRVARHAKLTNNFWKMVSNQKGAKRRPKD